MSEREPLDPIIEKQMEVWVYTHPKPEYSTIAFGPEEYSPKRILEEVREGSEMGQSFQQFLAESSERFNTPGQDFIQGMIEANLRPAGMGAVLEEVRDQELDDIEKANLIKRNYFPRLLRVPGIVGVEIDSEIGGLRLLIKSDDVIEKLPMVIEGLPISFLVIGSASATLPKKLHHL